MTREDIICYRTNYEPKSWKKHADAQGWLMMPVGIVDAVACLCNEIDRLNKWGKTKAIKSSSRK